MNEIEAIILKTLAEYITCWGNGICDGEWWAVDQNPKSYAAKVRRAGFSYEPAEIAGHPLSPADKLQFSRALARLEADGLIIVDRPKGRARHFRATPDGLVAGLLLADVVDAEAIRLALADFEWPGDFAAVLDAIESEGVSDDDDDDE